MEAAPVDRARRESIRAELETTRATLRGLLDSLSEEEWRRPSAIPAWSNGELIFHMAINLTFVWREVEVIRKVAWLPQTPRYLFDLLNNRIARWGARLATRQAIARRYETAYQAVIALVATLVDDEWRQGTTFPAVDPPFIEGYVTIEQLIRYHARHFHEHLSQLRLGPEAS